MSCLHNCDDGMIFTALGDYRCPCELGAKYSESIPVYGQQPSVPADWLTEHERRGA